MKQIYIQIILLFFVLTISSESYSYDKFPILQGTYMGQTPPGLTPKIFAPGIVSLAGRYEGAISFSPDLKEVYFGANNKNKETAIYFSKLENNQWIPIKKADFTQGKKDEEIHPFVSLDGKRIYFTGLNSDLSDTRIWYVNRLKNSWSKAVKLGSPINDGQVFYPVQSTSGDLYYFNLLKGKNYIASNSNGDFLAPKEVTIEFGVHAYISPSQDYLLVNARNKDDDSRKDNELYVYFKKQDGTWTKAISLGGAVNTHSNEKTPTISPDGKYLFFGRDEADGKANIYWVSTKVIENLRPKK